MDRSSAQRQRDDSSGDDHRCRLFRHGEILVLRVEGNLQTGWDADAAPYARDRRFQIAERIVLDLGGATALTEQAARRILSTLEGRGAGSVRIAGARAAISDAVRSAAAARRFPLHPDLAAAIRAFSAQRSRVHVIEHPLFDRIDVELRALLELHRVGSAAEIILNFVPPQSTGESQVMLIYQPARKTLKRLAHDPSGDPARPSRLEVWRNVGRDEIHELAEIGFLERTRPRCLEPDVSLGVLEQILEKDGPRAQNG
jgi:hypothetical protein